MLAQRGETALVPDPVRLTALIEHRNHYGKVNFSPRQAAKTILTSVQHQLTTEVSSVCREACRNESSALGHHLPTLALDGDTITSGLQHTGRSVQIGEGIAIQVQLARRGRSAAAVRAS